VEPQGEERLPHHAREDRRTRGVKYEPFATGFYRGDDVFGRPVDLLMLQDGSMLVSDDQSDAIYRISYAVP
jgi:glucose/arabinose dehydrogenase